MFVEEVIDGWRSERERVIDTIFHFYRFNLLLLIQYIYYSTFINVFESRPCMEQCAQRVQKEIYFCNPATLPDTLVLTGKVRKTGRIDTTGPVSGPILKIAEPGGTKNFVPFLTLRDGSFFK